MNKKILFSVLVLVTIISVSLTVYFITKPTDDEDDIGIDNLEIIDKDEIIKDKRIGNLEISMASFSIRDNITTYYAVVTNKGSSEYKIDTLYVLFKYKDEEKKIPAIMDTLLKAGDKTELSIDFSKLDTNIEKIEFLINE